MIDDRRDVTSNVNQSRHSFVCNGSEGSAVVGGTTICPYMWHNLIDRQFIKVICRDEVKAGSHLSINISFLGKIMAQTINDIIAGHPQTMQYYQPIW